MTVESGARVGVGPWSGRADLTILVLMMTRARSEKSTPRDGMVVASWALSAAVMMLATTYTVPGSLAASSSGLGNVAFMILGWIEMCPRPVGSAFQRRTLRRYQAR